MATLSAIFRYPIKSHGRESLGEVALTAGKTMPMDRAWAVTHEATKFDMDAPAWVACANFSIGAKSPTLNAINADWDAGRGVMTLTHPDYPPLVFRPDDTDDHAAFIDWVSPMVPANRAAPRGLVRLSERGMTDTDYPSISLNSSAQTRRWQRLRGSRIYPWNAGVAICGLMALMRGRSPTGSVVISKSAQLFWKYASR